MRTRWDDPRATIKFHVDQSTWTITVECTEYSCDGDEMIGVYIVDARTIMGADIAAHMLKFHSTKSDAEYYPRDATLISLEKPDPHDVPF